MRFNRKCVGISAFVALLVVAALALPGLAQMQPRRSGNRQGPNLFFLMRAAQLSDEQKTQARAISQNSRQNTRQIISQLMPLRQQLNSALFTTGAADPSILTQINALQNQLQQERLNVFQQVWSQVLNPTQQSQVASAFAQFEANRAQRQSAWKALKQQPTP
jgi:ABC-type phosphate/phosphonate transport system substrate-binding protein